MKKLLGIVVVGLLFNGNAFSSSHSNELKLREIINYFNFCNVPSSFGPSCGGDSNPRDYLNSLKITVNENMIHYKEDGEWEYYFTIVEQSKDETIVSFEDLAIRGTYKGSDLFKFKFDKDSSTWKLDSIKSVYPNNESEYSPYKE